MNNYLDPLSFTDVEDYKSETCNIDYSSQLKPYDAENIIGKKVTKIEAGEYSLILYFDDGDILQIEGHTYRDCPLLVEYLTKRLS